MPPGVALNGTIPQLVRSAGGGSRRVMRDTSTLLFLTQLVSAGSAVVANVVAARAMDLSGRGELALLLQIGYFGSLAVLLGCDRSVVAVYTGSPARLVTTEFLRLILRPSAVALLGAAVIIALPLPGLGSWRVRLALAALFMVVNALTRVVRSVAIAADRAPQYLWYGITEAALLLVGLGALMAFGISASAAWMVVYLLAGLGAAAGWLWRWTRTLPGDEQHDAAPDPDRRRRTRREGLQLFPATVAHSGTLRIDRLILVGLASTAALGLYATVSTMIELITWPLLVFADSRLGLWRQAHDGGTLSLRRVLVVAVLYAVVAAGLVTVVLRLLLVPLLGRPYAAALPLVAPLAIAAAVFGLSQLFVTALTAIRRGRLASVVEVIGVAVSVTAYVLLIDRFGALGAAYGSLIGYTTCLGLAALLFLRVRGAPYPQRPVPGLPAAPRIPVDGGPP